MIIFISIHFHVCLLTFTIIYYETFIKLNYLLLLTGFYVLIETNPYTIMFKTLQLENFGMCFSN